LWIASQLRVKHNDSYSCGARCGHNFVMLRNINWVFGQNGGLHFAGTVSPFSNRPISTIEGCASMSDVNGNLLVYSDGLTVCDGAGVVRASGLPGNHSSTQGVAIVPHPVDPKKYYVFTTDAGGLSHVSAIVIDTGTWASTPVTFTPPAPTTGFLPSERVLAIRHANPKFFWLLTTVRTPLFQSNTGPGTLRVFLVDATGVHYVADHPFGLNIGDIGYMKASPGGKRIAIADFWAARVYVLPFSITTGSASLGSLINIHTVPVPSPHNAPCPYGVEFSQSGENVYYTAIYPLTIANSPTTDGLIYQFFLPSGPPVLIGAHPRAAFLSMKGDLCALQYGADGRIYIAQLDQPNLGVIAHPNAFGAACGLAFNAISLPKASTCKNGLPNMIRDLF
jgi:hypothetical protein